MRQSLFGFLASFIPKVWKDSDVESVFVAAIFLKLSERMKFLCCDFL